MKVQLNTTREKIITIKESILLDILKFRKELNKSLPFLKHKLTNNYLSNKAQKAPQGRLVEAVIKGKTAGFLAWIEELDGAAYLWWVMVLPGYRRKGIAGFLIDRALRDIKKAGYKKIWTKVKNDNYPMLSVLFRRHFFIKGLTNEQGLSVILLEKKI